MRRLFALLPGMAWLAMVVSSMGAQAADNPPGSKNAPSTSTTGAPLPGGNQTGDPQKSTTAPRVTTGKTGDKPGQSGDNYNFQPLNYK